MRGPIPDPPCSQPSGMGCSRTLPLPCPRACGDPSPSPLLTAYPHENGGRESSPTRCPRACGDPSPSPLRSQPTPMKTGGSNPPPPVVLAHAGIHSPPYFPHVILSVAQRSRRISLTNTNSFPPCPPSPKLPSAHCPNSPPPDTLPPCPRKLHWRPKALPHLHDDTLYQSKLRSYPPEKKKTRNESKSAEFTPTATHISRYSFSKTSQPHAWHPRNE